MRIQGDVAVVGGGSAGAVVAARLAAAGVQVVLVEAGPDYGPLADHRWPAEIMDATELALTHDWGYGSGPVVGREPWLFERARIMGGCSSHNGAIAAVGHASDYDGWGLAGWRTDELRPLFAEVVAKMRVRPYDRSEAGPFHARCLEVARRQGWRVASDLCDLDANDSFGLETVNVVDGVRWNTAFAYLDDVRDRPNLRIVDRTIVDRIVPHPDDATVVGRRDGEELTIDAGTVVLAGGVYGTPAILQRSGIGDPDRLGPLGITTVTAVPGVGANLHDHPMLLVTREVGPDLRGWLDEAARAGFVPEEQTLGKALSSQTVDGIFDLHVFPVCASTQTSILKGEAAAAVACMTPRSRGRLDIVDRDPETAPRIDHAYLTDPDDHDITVMRDGIAIGDRFLDDPELHRILGRSTVDLSDDDAIRRNVVHYYHPVGTCRMGHDELAVCDEQGRVHGVGNVVVADASLMPQVPRANTNLPTVMIGERIAAFLLGH